MNISCGALILVGIFNLIFLFFYLYVTNLCGKRKVYDVEKNVAKGETQFLMTPIKENTNCTNLSSVNQMVDGDIDARNIDASPEKDTNDIEQKVKQEYENSNKEDETKELLKNVD